jgi:hypothetical protein
MARQTGARTAAALAFESTYGVAPGAGYRLFPYAKQTLGAERPLLENEVLGFGRDPLAPQRDASTTDGDITIPIDVENFGLWLKMAFGQPTVAGVVAATGSFTFTAQPAVSATISVGGTTFTFVASGATGNQCNIGVNLAATMTALAVALNASVVPAVAAVTYAATATQITMVHDTLGHIGNSFALAASTSPASNATPSAATLTGGANTHTFNSGNWVLPSASIETQMPEVPAFPMYSGLMLDALSWTMGREGLLQAVVKLIGQGKTPAVVTGAGSPTSFTYQRFGHFNGAVSRNGSALGSLVSADIMYGNNLDPVAVIRADGKIDGIDPGIAMLSGNFVVRLNDNVLETQALDGTPCEIGFTYSLGASAAFSFTAHAVYLPQPRAGVEGPQGVQATFAWQAARAVSPARMCTAVLTNGVATY